MPDKEEVFDQIKVLLTKQHFGVLATQGIGYPYLSLVGFASAEDCREIIFATIRDSNKYKNLIKTPKVSLLIDSQTNKANDLEQAQALTILGEAREVNSESKSDYLSVYLKKLPGLKEFIDSSDCALIKVCVNKYVLVNNFQNIQEYTF